MRTRNNNFQHRIALFVKFLTYFMHRSKQRKTSSYEGDEESNKKIYIFFFLNNFNAIETIT